MSMETVLKQRLDRGETVANPNEEGETIKKLTRDIKQDDCLFKKGQYVIYSHEDIVGGGSWADLMDCIA